MQNLKENIASILVNNNCLSQDKLDQALKLQKQRQVPLRRVLVSEGFISEEELLGLLSQHLFIPRLHLAKYKFSPEIIGLIPERMARQYNIIPLSRIGSTLTVSMSDPLDIFALDDIKNLTDYSVIDIVLSPEEEIRQAIDKHYRQGMKQGMQEILQRAEADMSAGKAQGRDDIELVKQEDIELTSALEESKKAPIVKLVNLVLQEALKRRASDIHVEPEEDCLRIRLRIDGALYDAFRVPKSNQNAILARLKIIANLDITENRVPQDGRFKVKFEGKEVDLRVSSLPTTFGQKFVLRLLDKSSLSVGLDALGFSERQLFIFKEAISKPFGMILVTGPTGSGKSTTLYSILNQINTPEKNIVTIEDPVEYQIEGVTQIQVKPEIGLDFASGLRSILRQSPDVIMIGEIRDPETADIAIKAALTGQLLFSTLHTNDAVSSIIRLINMGVEPFLAASSLIALCAQRLIRKLCLKCRKPAQIPQELLRSSGINFPGGQFYSAAGCKYCNNTGFYGRLAILEAVLIDDVIREMVIKKVSVDEIKQYAVKECGMISLRDDAFLKVKNGLTTIEEALQATKEE